MAAPCRRAERWRRRHNRAIPSQRDRWAPAQLELGRGRLGALPDRPRGANSG